MATLYRVRTAISGPIGGPALSTMYFGSSGGTAQQAADAVRAFWQAARLRICTGWTIQVQPLVYDLDIATGLLTGVHSTSTSSVAGTQSTDPAAGFTQGLAQWHTGFFIAGRELIGKTFLPGVGEVDSTNGAPSSNYLTDMTAAAVGLQGAANAVLTIYSRTHHSSVGVATASVSSNWAVLKSRR
jgi:hypothetical protein